MQSFVLWDIVSKHDMYVFIDFRIFPLIYGLSTLDTINVQRSWFITIVIEIILSTWKLIVHWWLCYFLSWLKFLLGRFIKKMWYYATLLSHQYYPFRKDFFFLKSGCRLLQKCVVRTKFDIYVLWVLWDLLVIVWPLTLPFRVKT